MYWKKEEAAKCERGGVNLAGVIVTACADDSRRDRILNAARRASRCDKKRWRGGSELGAPATSRFAAGKTCRSDLTSHLRCCPSTYRGR